MLKALSKKWILYFLRDQDESPGAYTLVQRSTPITTPTITTTPKIGPPSLNTKKRNPNYPRIPSAHPEFWPKADFCQKMAIFFFLDTLDASKSPCSNTTNSFIQKWLFGPFSTDDQSASAVGVLLLLKRTTSKINERRSFCDWTGDSTYTSCE